MATSNELFSKITGEYIQENQTIIAAYLKNCHNLRVFFESREQLHELKIDCFLLGSDLVPQRFKEKDPTKGAKKDRSYFKTLARSASHQIKTISNEEAERIFKALTEATSRPLNHMWSKVIREFQTALDISETAHQSTPLL